MRWVAVWLSVLLLARFCHAADDARLDKPVTLAVKGEALADIFPMIEKQTGVHLRVAHDIADQKATIFIDDKPLKEVMAGLKTVFRYTWSYTDFKGERSYSLSMPVKLRRERENWHEKAVDKAWHESEAEIKRLAEMPVKTREELDKMFEQTEFTDEKTIPPVYLVSNSDWERRKKAAAHLYQTLSPDLVKALRDGMTLCWSLDSPEPEWKIPASLEAEFREGTIFYDVELNFPETRKKKDFGTLTVELSASSTAEKFAVEVYERLGKAPDTMGYVFNVYEKLLSRLVAPPENSLPRKEDDPVLDSKISYTAKELEEEAALPKSLEPWREETYVNRSDLLALLHKKLGLQIISDHYSHWYSWQPADKLPVRAILESFERFPGARQDEIKVVESMHDEGQIIRLANEYPAADWGWEGKLLYMRAASPARMDSREIPNRILRRWKEASKAGPLGLNEMAEIHTLGKDQFDTLGENRHWLGVEIWQDNVISISPTLRLYGLLSTSQQKLALDGLLSTRAFNAEQRSALLDLVPNAGNASARKGSRVGIYDKAGRRVDKPDAASPGLYPESIRLETKSQEEIFATDDRQVAKTLDQALKEIGEWERPLLRKLVYTTYEMTLTYADGSETRKKTGIFTCTPWRLPTEPLKTDQ